MLPPLPSLDTRWYENRARGLVYTRSPTELTFRLYFPEIVGKKAIEIVGLVVGHRIAHCSVAGPFAALFGGETRTLYLDSRVLFSSHGGFDREDPTDLQVDEYVEQNVRAAESLLDLIDARREFYRDQHLPDWDLRSGIFEMFVKDYTFRRAEFATAALAAEEFCRRFDHKPRFQELFHPEVSARRFFER